MRRRSVLAGSIGLAGSLAGCLGVLDRSGGSGSSGGAGPAATIEAFYEAALSGDAEAARSYFHPDAAMPPPPDRAVENVQQSTLQFEGATVIEKAENRATVEVTVSQKMMGGERQERTSQFLLRRHEGEWKIYDQPLPEPDRQSVPNVQWDVSERTDGDAVTAVVFTHAGGDTVDPTTLSASVDGSTVEAPGTASEVEAGTGVVVPFEARGEPVVGGEGVDLVWTAPQGDTSQTVASFTLTSDTAGSPAGQLRIE